MRINFDFTDLEAFLAVMETGSFHDAGARLNLSQSSVSRRIQKLEISLDSPLFERTTREVRPTLAAKRLQQRAEAILDEMKETTRAMRDESVAFAHQRTQQVTVATIPTVISSVIAPALSRVRVEGRHIRLRLLDLSANQVAEAVSQGTADFGICSIPLLEPATDFETLFSDPIVLGLQTDHPLATSSAVAWRELSGEPLILPSRGTGNRLVIDEALARSRHPLRWTYEVGRSTSAMDLIAEGVGVAPLPRSALASASPQKVAWKPLNRPVVTRPVGILRRSARKGGPAAASLIDAIRRTINEHVLHPI